ncbi:MAG TPA: site-2 protease family protein [Candidatus Thermoplasmatota archaeon]|nr:site-2 protease family protein [Candidatus Thermoplasmatota archaeon]
MQGTLIAIGLLAAYIVFVFWLVSSGRLQKWNLSLMLGIVLMVRTQRGKGILDALARPRRAWNLFADLGTVLTLAGMVLMTIVFAWSVWFSLQPDSGVEPLGASEILVIPGVNPFVPLWYGLVALIITLVVHEGGHGVLARANDMRVKSMGLLIAVVPIGAFVEPDDEDLRLAPRRKRLRVFAAGPTVNLAFAVLSLLAFSALVGAVTPVAGVHVASVVKDAPAQRAGLEAGSTITAVDATPMPDWPALRAFLDGTHPGQEVTLTLRDGSTHPTTLQSRWDALTPQQRDQATSANATRAEALQKASFLGIRPLLPEDTTFLAHPFTSGAIGFLSLVSLPIGEVRGAPVLSTYLPAFNDAPFAPALFWPLALVLFWVFWINLMVGLTNILPMLPLDGGHIFRDAVGGLVQRLRPSMEAARRERLVGWTAGAMSLLILGAFILQILGPRLVG